MCSGACREPGAGHQRARRRLVARGVCGDPWSTASAVTPSCPRRRSWTNFARSSLGSSASATRTCERPLGSSRRPSRWSPRPSWTCRRAATPTMIRSSRPPWPAAVRRSSPAIRTSSCSSVSAHPDSGPLRVLAVGRRAGPVMTCAALHAAVPVVAISGLRSGCRMHTSWVNFR